MSESAKTSWMATAQSELFHGWQRWASFACIWAWSGLAGPLAQMMPEVGNLPSMFSSRSGIILFTSVVSLFVLLMFSRKINTIVASRPFMIAIGSVLSTASIGMALGSFFSNASLFIAGAAAGGIALSPLKIAWGEMYSFMDFKRGIISMGFSLISSTLLVILVLNLPSSFVAITLVAISLPCAYLAFRGAKKIDSSIEKEKRTLGSVSFSYSLLLLPAMVALSYGLMRGLMPGLSAAENVAANISTNYAELLTGVLLLVLAHGIGKKVGPAQVYSGALILVVAGLVLVASQAVFPWISLSIHNMGFTLFYSFMIVYWGDLSWRTGMPIVRIYTIGYFTFQLMNMFGTLLGYLDQGVQAQNTSILIVLAIVLGLFVVALLMFGNSGSSLRQWLIAAESSLEQGDEIPHACSAIVAQYGLSPREQEVLGLLARGRNASHIAQLLYISPGTAKTHIRNIYKKLDVHTHQELLDLIEKNLEN